MTGPAGVTARGLTTSLLSMAAALLFVWFVASEDAKALRGPGSLTLYVLLASRGRSGGVRGDTRSRTHGVVRPLPRQPRRDAHGASRRSSVVSPSSSSSPSSSLCSPAPSVPATVLPPHIRFDLVNGTCPVCAAPLGHEPLCHCLRCATLHHERCFAWAGSCSTYGCQSSVSRPGVPGAPPARPRARSCSRSRRRTAVVRPSFASVARDEEASSPGPSSPSLSLPLRAAAPLCLATLPFGLFVLFPGNPAGWLLSTLLGELSLVALGRRLL